MKRLTFAAMMGSRLFNLTTVADVAGVSLWKFYEYRSSGGVRFTAEEREKVRLAFLPLGIDLVWEEAP